MKLFSKLPLTILIALGINACGGGSNSNSLTPSLTGTAQKGSYLIDSSVSFSQLSAQGAITSKSAKTTITNNLGKFATDLSWNDWTKITVSGLYFNEFTGTNSKTALTLKSITDVGTSSGDININLFTHLIAARIQKLTNTGKSLSASKQQALKELKILLDFDTKKIEKLNIGENNKRGNAVLLLFSAGFLSSTPDDNKRSARLLNLADDFADNGLLDGKAKTLFKAIATYAGKPNVFALLTPNLKKKGYKNPPSAKTLGKLPTWLILDKSKNRLPIADAGKDQTIIQGEHIVLQGKGTDSDGSIKAYQWTQDNKVLSKTSTLKRNNLPVGKYTYTLGVTDNQGAKGVNSVTIHVKTKTTNKKPIANAGTNKTITVGDNLTLQGKGSDYDGSITSYQWKLGSKVVSNSATLSLNNLSIGNYTYTLIVTDNKGAKGTDSVTIHVNKKTITNKKPTANAGTNKTITVGDNITLQGKGSDSDGSITSYQWKLGSKVVSNSATLSLNNLSIGNYTYTLIVTDNKGAKGTDSVTIHVNKKTITNKKPTANAGTNKTITVGDNLTLQGKGTDSDGSITSYQWKLGSKVVSNSATLSLNNLSVGNYTYTLIVSDNKGAKGTDSVIIHVNKKIIANKKPTANAGGDQTITAGESITLIGKGTDTDGSIRTYQWTQDSKVVSKSATLKLNNLSTGDYTYTLTVTDNKGSQDSDKVMVHVKANTVEPLATIKVNIHDIQCVTVAGMHLRLESTLTGSTTGQGPLYISQYTQANCSGSVTSLPSFIDSPTTATYIITNITNIGGRKRTGTMTVTALSQTRSGSVNIDANGNVSRQ